MYLSVNRVCLLFSISITRGMCICVSRTCLFSHILLAIYSVLQSVTFHALLFINKQKHILHALTEHLVNGYMNTKKSKIVVSGYTIHDIVE